MDFTVYILFSESKNRYYIGFTSNLEERLILIIRRVKVLQEMQMIGKLFMLKIMKLKKMLIKESFKLNLGKAELKSKH